MKQQRIIRTAFPPGFWDRWQAGPCNNALCGHPWCPAQRAELREFGLAQAARIVRHGTRGRGERRGRYHQTSEGSMNALRLGLRCAASASSHHMARVQGFDCDNSQSSLIPALADAAFGAIVFRVPTQRTQPFSHGPEYTP